MSICSYKINHDVKHIMAIFCLKYKYITKKANHSVSLLLNQRLPILPGRLQPSTFGVYELNYCVRDGNRWTLVAIATESVRVCTLKTT